MRLSFRIFLQEYFYRVFEEFFYKLIRGLHVFSSFPCTGNLLATKHIVDPRRVTVLPDSTVFSGSATLGEGALICLHLSHVLLLVLSAVQVLS